MNVQADELEIRRAPRLKAEDVYAAADALLVDGHRPTIDRVRMKLGRGSPNTISEHLDTWWAQLGARFRDAAGLALPALPEAIAMHLTQLWTLALRESQQALRGALAERETDLATQRAVLDEREAALNERELAAVGRLDAQASALRLAERQLEEANQRARSLEEALRQRQQEVDAARARIIALEQETLAARQQLHSEQQRHLAERTRLDERYDALQNRSAQDIDRLQQAQKDDRKLIKGLRAELDHVATERDKARADLKRLNVDLKVAKARYERLAQQSKRSKATSKVPNKRGIVEPGKKP